ncbi:hypothetical protein D9757_004827 [Collybiopsis confluens]|uniref:Uncharacterized protein n=1 Tax=Collybiopsis confluens TaxID=2823264 RepID=A0A8H5MBT2_9AGAR|nr:hypothetical protein D9757_004827 [Collybiopsis confluens]
MSAVCAFDCMNASAPPTGYSYAFSLEMSEFDDEDYGADDERECGDDPEDEPADAAPFQLFRYVFPDEEKSMSTPPRHFACGSVGHSPASARSPVCQVPIQSIAADSDDYLDDELSDMQDYAPGFDLFNAMVFSDPQSYILYTDDTDEDDDSETPAPSSHCPNNCISCARERLQAEGWKPVYRYDEPEQECIRDTEQELSDLRPKEDDSSCRVFSPPPPGLLMGKVNVSFQFDGSDCPRVFFPPPRDSQYFTFSPSHVAQENL